MKLNNVAKGVLVVVGILIVFFLAASFYVAANGKKIFLSEIEKKLGAKVEVASIKVSFPATIIVDGFAVADKIKVSRIIVSPSFLSLFRDEVILNSVVLEKPSFTVTRNPSGTFDFGLGAPQKKEEAPVISQAPGSALPNENKVVAKKSKKVYFNKLVIRNAEIILVDKRVDAPEVFTFRLAGINVDVSHPDVLDPYRVQFKSQGYLETTNNERVCNIDFAGWADVKLKNMNAKANLLNMNLVYAGPYYKKFLKKELKSGAMNVTSVLVSENNDLKADCHLELSNVAFKDIEAPVPTEGEAQPQDFTALALSSVLNANGKMVFDFVIRTKMDKPRFQKIKMKGVFLPAGIGSIVMNSPKNAEDFKKVGDQFKAIGKEFKKAFKPMKE